MPPTSRYRYTKGHPLEEQAQKLASAVEQGLLTVEELQTQLEERLGTDASGILNDEGSLDVSALTTLLSSYAPDPASQGSASASLPPPPGVVDLAQLQAVLSETYGEDDVTGIFSEDGSVDFAQLKSLLQTNAASTSGNLVDLSA